MKQTVISKLSAFLLFILTSGQKVLAQIPQNIDVINEGEKEPLENAPPYMVLMIILLLIAFVFYIFFYRRKR